MAEDLQPLLGAADAEAAVAPEPVEPGPPASEPPPGPKALSPSQLKLYEDCPKKWMFRYIQKLPDPSGLAAVIGSFAHSVLEDLMLLEPAQRTRDQARAIAREKFNDFSRTPGFAELNLGPPAIARFKWRAWISIKKLWGLEDPQEVDVNDVELKLSCEVAGVPFLGFIDRLDNTPEGLVINDYKSGKPNFAAPNADPQRIHLENSHVFQVMLYAAAVAQELSQMPAGVRLLYLGDQPGVLPEDVTPEKLEDVSARLAEGWRNISSDRASGNFKAKTSPLCGWCAFLSHCPEGMDKVIELRDSGRLKESAPALRMKEILLSQGAFRQEVEKQAAEG